MMLNTPFTVSLLHNFLSQIYRSPFLYSLYSASILCFSVARPLFWYLHISCLVGTLRNELNGFDGLICDKLWQSCFSINKIFTLHLFWNMFTWLEEFLIKANLQQTSAIIEFKYKCARFKLPFERSKSILYSYAVYEYVY